MQTDLSEVYGITPTSLPRTGQARLRASGATGDSDFGRLAPKTLSAMVSRVYRALPADEQASVNVTNVTDDRRSEEQRHHDITTA